MSKFEVNSIYATLISGATIQSDDFSFTGSLILNSDLLSAPSGTLDIGSVFNPFAATYTHVISNPSSNSDLQINSSNGGDIRFTINGSTDEWKIDDSTGNIVGMNGSASIRHNLNDAAVQICGGSSEDQSLGARVVVFGDTNGSDPGSVRIYAANTAGRSIKFYTDNAERWRVQNGHFFPLSNSTYDVGTDALNCRFVYTNVVVNSITSNALDISSTNGGGIQFAIDGASKLFMDGSTLRPNTNGGMDLGAVSQRYSTVYAAAFSNANTGGDVTLAADDDIVLKTGGVNRWVVFDPGVLRPNIDSTYPIGTTGNRCSAVHSDAFLPFTGSHIYKVKDGESLSAGDAVCIHNQEVKKCDESESPTCIGLIVTVASGSEMDLTNEGVLIDSFQNEYSTSGTSYIFATVAQCGDNVTTNLPGFKVCDENGSIMAGDLLCTASGHPGYLKKWTPNINTFNCIVGKAYETVTFSGGKAEGIYGTLQG